MKKVWNIFKRVTVLVLAAVWLQTVAHTVVCHSDNALCGHDGCSESTVCTCFCHMAFEPANDAPLFIEQPTLVPISSSNETISGLLLTADIFRPPLTNS